MLHKKQIWAIFLFKFKMGHKTADTTRNINNAFDPGTANKCTVQWWFKKFCKEDKSLEDEERSGRPSEVDKHATTMANWEDRQGSSCYNHTRSGQRPQRQPFYRSALETNRKGEKAQ